MRIPFTNKRLLVVTDAPLPAPVHRPGCSLDTCANPQHNQTERFMRNLARMDLCVPVDDQEDTNG